MLLQLCNNINKHSPWMLSLEIFGSACAAAADYRQIRCWPSIPAAASKDLKPNIITLHSSLQVCVKFSVRKKVFIYFIFYIYLKWMGLNLSTNLPMFVYTFEAMWRQRPLKEYSVFVGIRAFVILSFVHLLWYHVASFITVFYLERTRSIQNGYRKCKTHARVFSRTPAQGNS